MAQTTISGVINDYTKVTAISPCQSNYISVLDPSKFSANDTVLVIQMQGATIAIANSGTFGDITSIDNAGNYEFNEILSIIGNDVYLKYALQKSYTPATGSVQMISIPQYTNVVISGTLTAKKWDGTVGGVLVFQASGDVILNGNVDLSNLGFRKGSMSATGGDCYTSLGSPYFYAYPNVNGGQKGEGIAGYISGQESGRGKNANGGGGGNSHNTGGGGGANYGSGGRGGDKTSGCSGAFTPNPYGLGGLALTSYYSQNKIFMGGGGGGGQQNNNVGLDGGSGGGIVIIKSASIIGNGYSIISKGESKDIFSLGDSGDGAGGGGAGGAILLESGTFSMLTTDVSGGKGGDNSYYDGTKFNAYGPGGGGGGGVVWVSTSVFPTSDITSYELGGANGISRGLNTSSNASYGGVGQKLVSLNIPKVQNAFVPCTPTPVTLISFSSKENNGATILYWSTVKESGNNYFVIEKSKDGIKYEPIGYVSSNGNSNAIQSYSYIDHSESSDISYYYLKQVDKDGQQNYLGSLVVRPSYNPNFIEKVYPNPFTNELTIECSDLVESSNTVVKFYNIVGVEANLNFHSINRSIRVDTRPLSKGIYFIQITQGEKTEIRKIIKE